MSLREARGFILNAASGSAVGMPLKQDATIWTLYSVDTALLCPWDKAAVAPTDRLQSSFN
jgi:hypothetical protein